MPISSKAPIPALNRLGIKPVGVFVQQERTGDAGRHRGQRCVVGAGAASRIRHWRSFAAATRAAECGPGVSDRRGRSICSRPRANPAFERIDSWLMLAFAGMPKLELPAYCREKKPRMFELRTYESHSELKALKKVEMFNAGEIQLMRDVGLGPIFFGQALIGSNLPHLTYMLSAENQEAHKKHWDAFQAHPDVGQDEERSAIRGYGVQDHESVPGADGVFADLRQYWPASRTTDGRRWTQILQTKLRCGRHLRQVALRFADMPGDVVAGVVGRHVGFAAEPSGRFTVDVFGTAQGLPSSAVLAVTQTRDGYLWVGTLAGPGAVRWGPVRGLRREQHARAEQQPDHPPLRGSADQSLDWHGERRALLWPKRARSPAWISGGAVRQAV